MFENKSYTNKVFYMFNGINNYISLQGFLLLQILEFGFLKGTLVYSFFMVIFTIYFKI